MATLKTKKLIQVGTQHWEVKEEYNGKVQTLTELAVKAAGDRGPENMILRTSSKKLIEALKPDVEVHGYVFQDGNTDRYPSTWRISAKAKDNEHLTGGWNGGSGGSGRPSTGHGGGGQGVHTPYTFDEIVALFGACLEQARGMMGEMSDESVQAGTATMFIACKNDGVKVGAGGGTRANEEPEDLPFDDGGSGDDGDDSDQIPF